MNVKEENILDFFLDIHLFFWFFWKLDGLSWGAEPLTIHLIYTSWLRTQSSRIYHRTVKTVQTANWDIRDQIFVISFYIFISQSCKLCKLQTGKLADEIFVIYLFIYLSHRVVQNVQTTNWDIRGSYIFSNINLTDSCKPCKLQTGIFVDQEPCALKGWFVSLAENATTRKCLQGSQRVVHCTMFRQFIINVHYIFLFFSCW